jgi:putative addiction module component (TIGR02574 family)
MANPAIEEILRLPVSERIEAAGAIWDSLADAAEAQALAEPSDEQRVELRRRIAEHDRGPSTAIPLEEVRRKLRVK